MHPDGTDVESLTARRDPSSMAHGPRTASSSCTATPRRGINEDDEIYIVRADGTGGRNLTTNPANDWGPDWSSDGQWIVFNSDRDGGALGGYVVRPDGSDLRRLPIDGWVEYATFSPDGTRIAFMGHVGSDYDIFVAEIASGETTRLTDASGSDGWPAWSPDGVVDRLRQRTRRLHPGARRRRLLARRRTRGAPRHLDDGRRRLEPTPRHARVRSVRHVVTRWPLSPHFRTGTLCCAARRHRASRAARRWVPARPRRNSRLDRMSSPPDSVDPTSRRAAHLTGRRLRSVARQIGYRRLVRAGPGAQSGNRTQDLRITSGFRRVRQVPLSAI